MSNLGDRINPHIRAACSALVEICLAVYMPETDDNQETDKGKPTATGSNHPHNVNS